MCIPVSEMSNILSQVIDLTHTTIKARPGVGTTYTITQILKEKGCDPLILEVDEHTSGYEMVFVLHENHDRTILMHVAESTFKDGNHADLEAVLKAAADGFIQFHSLQENLAFQFSGKLIFTTYGNLPEALQQRTVFIEFN